MQKFRYNFLFVLALVLAFGTLADVSAQNKRQKNMGILSVKTSPESYPVRVDGEVLGMSGVGTGAEFYLSPGRHLVEVEGANGQTFRKELDFVRNRKNCICLKVVETGTTRECPYNISVDGPQDFTEGSTITFTTTNIGSDPAIPVNYKWTVNNGTIVGGQGTSSIQVNTTGTNGQPVTAYLDVTDDIPGSTCQQKNEATSTPIPPVIPPQPYQCDVFESKSRDDDKARFDNCVLRLQTEPNSQIYVILYQGTNKGSINVDRLSKQTLDYFIRSRGVPPEQIVITKWGTRPRTTVEVWIVPPGAQPPVPR